MASKTPFRLSSLLSRLIFSLLLVFSTYNPTGYSAIHWLIDPANGPRSLKVVVILVLGILYYAIYRISFAAFGRSGFIAAGLAALLLSTDLVTNGFSMAAGSAWRFYLLLAQYVLLLTLAIVLAFGVSWSYIVQQLTGQLQKRYVRY